MLNKSDREYWQKKVDEVMDQIFNALPDPAPAPGPSKKKVAHALAYRHDLLSKGCLVVNIQDRRYGLMHSTVDVDGITHPVVQWEYDTFPSVTNPLLVHPARQKTVDTCPVYEIEVP